MTFLRNLELIDTLDDPASHHVESPFASTVTIWDCASTHSTGC